MKELWHYGCFIRSMKAGAFTPAILVTQSMLNDMMDDRSMKAGAFTPAILAGGFAVGPVDVHRSMKAGAFTPAIPSSQPLICVISTCAQ